MNGPVVPVSRRTRDRVLPILLVGSLIVHGAAFLPMLLHADAAPPPREIPVELVQAPPEPKIELPAKAKAKIDQQAKPAEPKQQAQAKEPAKQQDQTSKAKEKTEAKAQEKAEQKSRQAAAKSASRKQSAQEPQTDIAQRMKNLLDPFGMAAVALPGASATGEDTASYSQLVLSKVAKAKKEGRYKGIPGAASVGFTLDDNGSLASVALKRPSGDPDLDGEAIAMIKRGAPYPPPPPGGRRDYVVTLVFKAVL